MYKKEKLKQDERNRNRRPADRRNAEDIFRELQKSLHIPSSRGPEKTRASMPTTRVAMTKEPMIEKKVRPSMESRPKPVSSFDKKDQGKKAGKVVEPAKTPTMAETLDFDPRKAVIFSEILKRPQY